MADRASDLSGPGFFAERPFVVAVARLRRTGMPGEFAVKLMLAA